MKQENSDLPALNVLMCGHIDHGKTTLLHKISGKWTDTHSEELKRGITIRLGYADIIISDDNGKLNMNGKGAAKRYISFVDAPGHEMLMATMLSGAAIVDAALLIIAANEGIKPQTKEHLIALQAKNIKDIIIVQTKIDLVTKEQALKNYHEIKKLIVGTAAENAKIIPVSAQQEINLDAIYSALLEIKIPERNLDGKPIFVVARSFDINKPGTEIKNLKGMVLGGTLKQGKIKNGDEIEIKPGISIKEQNKVIYKPLITKVRNLFKGSFKVSELTPGGSGSIETELDMAIGKGDALSGNTVSLKGGLPEPTTGIKVSYSLFKNALGSSQEVQQIKSNELLLVSINTAVSAGNVKKVGPSDLDLSLRTPVVAQSGDNVGIARNINNHWRLIAHGKII